MADATTADDSRARMAEAVAKVIEANQAARAELMEAVDALSPERGRTQLVISYRRGRTS